MKQRESLIRKMSYSDEALEEDRMLKRGFLKESIINAGFSPQDFVDFCEAGQGADIDLYTLEQLQAIVVQFKESMASKAKAHEEEAGPERLDCPFDSAAGVEEEPQIHTQRRERHSLLFDDSALEEARHSKESAQELKSVLEPVAEQTGGEEPESPCADVEAVEGPRDQPSSVRESQKVEKYSISATSTISKGRFNPDSELQDVSYCIPVQRLPDTELSQTLQPKVLISE